MAEDHRAGTFAEARDRTGGDGSMRDQNQSGNYDHVRCATCGYPWGEHNPDAICERHRPICPSWVDEALARHEVARREVAGGVPTGECPANGGAGHAGS